MSEGVTRDQVVARVPASAPASRGKTALVKYLSGGRLTQRQAILAKCCDCMGYHRDGRIDCRVPACPLYPFMPYRETASPRSAEATTAPSPASNSLRTAPGQGAAEVALSGSGSRSP